MKRTITHIESIKKYLRVVNYLTAAQIYLQDNFLLTQKLTFDHIKPRLLGHWGTGPGINFLYAHLNAFIKENPRSVMFVLGPGHGFPALQANLFLEGTLERYYESATLDETGIAYIAKNFSWPYGFPSHSNPGTPGVILEGGELGYSLSTSYGAVLDNPDLTAVCLIGDGEAETAATATAWHLNKFVDPKTNGVVLPVLHLNGYKISGPTVYGRMSNKDLKTLFEGYGYDPIVVDGKDLHKSMAEALFDSFSKIDTIKETARTTTQTEPPKLPMIIMRTPKGWGGIKTLHGEKIEDNCLSHQVVGANAKTDKEELELVEAWLASYKFNEVFDRAMGPIAEIKDIIPDLHFRMGDNSHTMPTSDVYKPLILPEVTKFSEEVPYPGFIGSSSMRRAGLYMAEVFKLNEKNKNFRVLSPDETYSNKIDDIFKTTKRALLAPLFPWDRDYARDGRVIEMLSEHTLQGLAQGYTLSGRHAVFASYEAFIQVITSMADQYAKFLKAAREVPWRGDVPSLNYILTSSGWRQEHNGFSHQNPGFITDMLQKSGCFVRVFFPADGNSMLVTLKHALESKNGINIIAAGKTQEPRWLTSVEAEEEFATGLATWKFASEENPDIVFSAVGDYLTKEALAAISIVKAEVPQVRVRFVNILELSTIGIGNENCRVPIDFESFFTADKPVIFNFHGYPQTLKQVLFDYKDTSRFTVHGYIENGSTTTPFDMHVRNKTSRYHLALDAFAALKARKVLDGPTADRLIELYNDKLASHRQYIITHGVDPEEIELWQWKPIHS
jgi:xylulose-5-phosphate/fructose-6-phosphate phosphoketolase